MKALCEIELITVPPQFIEVKALSPSKEPVSKVVESFLLAIIPFLNLMVWSSSICLKGPLLTSNLPLTTREVYPVPLNQAPFIVVSVSESTRVPVKAVPLNASLPTLFNDEGILILVRLEQFLKAFLPILVNPSGRVTDVNFVPVNEDSPISVTVVGIFTSLRASSSSNKLSGIKVKDALIVTLLKVDELDKAPLPKLTKVSGKTTSLKWFPLKASSPILVNLVKSKLVSGASSKALSPTLVIDAPFKLSVLSEEAPVNASLAIEVILEFKVTDVRPVTSLNSPSLTLSLLIVTLLINSSPAKALLPTYLSVSGQLLHQS